ncbi:MAG: biotin transporter BioY [Chloroflexi bacterium]|nr:biotin transporter BioY [Chloroflexota bacterium]MCL5074317.1 biotin transporter BioY [Chloroflexota bacterium]
MQAHPTLTMTETVFPKVTILRNVLLILFFSLFTSISAQVRLELPFTPVPITGQTLAILLSGALLGSRRGALSVMVYIVEGALGLPVFAGGTAGLTRLLGVTGGYLIGFVPAAFTVGLLAERGWDRRISSAMAAMFIGNALIYLFGLPWLALVTRADLGTAVMLGLLPFLPGDVLKIVLAALVLPSGWALLRLNSAGRTR